MFFTWINAPHAALTIVAGKPDRVLPPGFHLIIPFVTTVRRISTALHTQEIAVDVITKGGTPTEIKVGYTARVVDVKLALINMDKPFTTLRASVISVVSGAANNYTIDELAQNKNEISETAQVELLELSKRFGWGLGDFQIAIGDPSLSDELKKLLMRQEAVRRESAANLEKAHHQIQVARQLVAVAEELEKTPFAQELLRLQVLADMGAGGKIIVVDSKSDITHGPVAKEVALPHIESAPHPSPPVDLGS